MAIDRPGAIEPHPRRSRRAAAQRRTAGRRLFCLARGMPSAGVPASRAGWPGRGKKWRPPLRADDRGAAGPRPDLPIRGPRGAPGTSARRRGGNRLHDARGRSTARGKTCAGAPTAAMQAREDTAGLTIGGARSACALGTNCIHGRSPSSEGYGPTSDAISRGRRRGEKRIDLRRRERPGARTVPEPKEAELVYARCRAA